ncbi:hypothetical protein D3C80_1332720 [compost metagenome]
MKKRFYIIPLFLLILVSSCNKPLLKYNSDFEGTWYSEAQYNSVMGKFQDTCAANLCVCTGKLTGKAEINQQRNKIRLNSQTPRVFVLDTEPYEQGGYWFMEVDGKTYKKQ